MAEAIRVRYEDPRLTSSFWTKVEVGPGGCWVWLDRLSKTGTPMHGAKVAWRFAYERLIDPLPKGSVGKRVCDRADCVNPAHRVVTPPAECPTCHQAMPASKWRIEASKLADGSIQLLRVTIDEDGGEMPPPDPDRDLLPIHRDGPRTVTREGVRAPRKRAERPSALMRAKLPVAADRRRKLTREEALAGLDIKKHPLPYGEPTGRWEPTSQRGKLVEFASGLTLQWHEMSDEQKSAFSRHRGKEKLEPGTFGREIERAMGSAD